MQQNFFLHMFSASLKASGTMLKTKGCVPSTEVQTSNFLCSLRRVLVLLPINKFVAFFNSFSFVVFFCIRQFVWTCISLNWSVLNKVFCERRNWLTASQTHNTHCQALSLLGSKKSEALCQKKTTHEIVFRSCSKLLSFFCGAFAFKLKISKTASEVALQVKCFKSCSVFRSASLFFTLESEWSWLTWTQDTFFETR